MASKPDTKLELDFVTTFVVRPKRARYSGFVVSPRLRPKFLAALHSFSDFDPRFKVRLPPREESRRGFLAELRRRGAGPNGYLISTNPDLDGATLPLEAAINEVLGMQNASIIICPSTSLAYFEGEIRDRFVLDSRPLEGAR